MRTIAIAAVLAFAAPAAAQREGPQPCGQETETADYGPVEVGTIVVVQRHRFVGGDPNWDDRMTRFLGRIGRVTRLSGVDERGCPGVRVDVDGGRWFWRVRDVNIGAERPTVEPRGRRASEVPQRCGLTDETAIYGRIRVGAQVVLGRHRPVEGDDNWQSEMTPFVGRSARVVRLAGTDSAGCPGVNVDVDGAEWFWRARDLRVGASDDDPVGYRPGLASDHGRPVGGAAGAAPVDERIPQMCGMTDDDVDYGPIVVGAVVMLGTHRPVGGEDNWVAEMEPFVGQRAVVTHLVGVDEQGCGLAQVDIDEGVFFWRIRDMRLAAP
ncbi:MAG: hypothetical protein H6719_28335 [Sandaracinaceae bacterium]|nr:hypothetical protein [Sandaracinaceae bacterium]